MWGEITWAGPSCGWLGTESFLRTDTIASVAIVRERWVAGRRSLRPTMRPHRRSGAVRDDGRRQTGTVYSSLTLAAERARLREANVMRFGRRAAAHDAWLRGDEFAVLLVAQTNGLRRNPAAADNGRFWSRCLGSVEGLALPCAEAHRSDCSRACDDASPVCPPFDRGEPLPESGFDKFSIGGGQRVLRREGSCGPSRRPRRRI